MKDALGHGSAAHSAGVQKVGQRTKNGKLHPVHFDIGVGHGVAAFHAGVNAPARDPNAGAILKSLSGTEGGTKKYMSYLDGWHRGFAHANMS